VAIHYHIYANNSAGGPVDYQTVIAAVNATSFAAPALSPGSDTTFAIRAFDPSSGLEEANVDARVRIILDAGGNDITGRPAAVVGLTARAAAGGSIVVHWVRNPAVQAARPTGYNVYMGSPTPSFSSPAASLADTGARDYRAVISGLTDGLDYQVVVRSFNATGEEQNTNAITQTAVSSGPNPVDGLSVSATFQG
jgi:hypothetical protein